MSFKIASRFYKAAVAVNAIPVEKFPLLLNRIFQKLHIKNTRLFSDEEEEQLQELFGFAVADLRLVLDCCCYIFEQAAFTSTGPEPLFDILLEAGFDEAHAKVLGRSWASEASDYVSKLKTQSLGFTSLQGTIDYHINMVVGQSAMSKQQEPTALLEFTIGSNSGSNPTATNTANSRSSGTMVSSGNDGCSTDVKLGHSTVVSKVSGETKTDTGTVSTENEKLCVEFSHEELFSFFSQLERMQHQLDALSTS